MQEKTSENLYYLEKPYRYKDARTIQKGPYIAEWCPGHPAAWASGGGGDHGYVLQHRLVLELKLGRFLGGLEIAHHIDGNTMNNSPENLMLFHRQKEHLRYEALSKWTEEEIELVRKVAADKKGRYEDIPKHKNSIRALCRYLGIKWVSAGKFHASEEEVKTALLKGTVAQAAKELGYTARTLYLNFPEVMKANAIRRQLVKDGQLDASVFPDVHTLLKTHQS